MKVLFVHDHKLKAINSKFYTTGGLSDEITKRYTDIFDDMTILCRAENVDKIENYTLIKNKKVKIAPIYTNFILPTKRQLSFIKKNVLECNAIIIRFPSISGIYAGIFAIKNNIPYMIEIVGNIFNSYWYKNFLGKVLAFPIDYFSKFIIKHAKLVLYVTDKYLQKKYPSQLMYGCSDVKLYKRDDNVLKKRIDKIENIEDKKLIFGTIGQINYKYKGHKTVFKVIKKLKKCGYKIEYKLVGSGNSKYLKKLANRYGICENVKFLGILKHFEIDQWLDSIDIYIQPSLTEGMPRSVIEALYRACPTIVSNAGGMPELVEKKYIFNKKNNIELFNIIRNLNKNELKENAKRNYLFSDKYSETKLNEKREKIYLMFRNEVYHEMVQK